MALTTPIISTFTPFDATANYTFVFNVISGDQVVANRIVIKKNSDNTIVYDNEVANFLYTHLIPGGTLENGTQYKIQVYTKNYNGIYSTPSDWTLFYCFSLPIIAITNISEGSVMANSTFTVEGLYSQSETDVIKSFRFILYDSNETLIQSYPEVISSTIEQEISGLLNNTIYKIELICISQSGVEVSTGLIGFLVQYIQPFLQSTLTLTNLPNSGEVKVDILAIQIEGIGEDYTFIDDDWVDVTAEGAYVFFDQIIDLINHDFCLRLHMKNIPSNTDFITIVGLYGNIKIRYYSNRFHVFKTSSSVVSHFVNFEDITFESTDKICLQISQINGLFDVTAEIYE